MKIPTYQEMLDAGVHFGHLRKKWNPKMRQYIFAEHKGIHIIDVNRTAERILRKLLMRCAILQKSGRKVMFVATKKQAREILAKAAQSVGMPHVTERWLGGMMTNFATIRDRSRKCTISKDSTQGSELPLLKKEKTHPRSWTPKNSIKNWEVFSAQSSSDALFFGRHRAWAYCPPGSYNCLGIKTFAMVDTTIVIQTW